MKDYMTPLIRALAVVILCWCFYWGVIYGPTVWGQDLGTSLEHGPINIFGLILAPFLLLFSQRIGGYVSPWLGWGKSKAQEKPVWPGLGSNPSRSATSASRQPRGPGGRFVKNSSSSSEVKSSAPAQKKAETFQEAAQKQAPRIITWRPNMPNVGKVKIQIPGFRTFKRILAFVFMVGYFVVGEMALTMPPSVPLGIVLVVTSFLMADYLWKTRKKAEKQQGVA